MVLSAIFSVDTYHSFFGFFGSPVTGVVSATLIIIAYHLVVSCITQTQLLRVWWASVVSGGIVAVWTFVTVTNLVPESVLRYVPACVTGSHTALAVFLVMLVPLFTISFWVVAQYEWSAWKKNSVYGVLVIVTCCTVVTFSFLHAYVQWVIALVAFGLMLVMLISRCVVLSKQVFIAVAGVFVCVLFFWMWGKPLMPPAHVQPESVMRLPLSMHIAKEALKTKPFLGSGPSTYGYNFSLHRPIDLNKDEQYDIRMYTDRGLLFESASTIGVVGMVTVGAIAALYVIAIVRVFVTVRNEEIRNIAMGLSASSVVALFFSLCIAVDGMIILYGVLLSGFLANILYNTPEYKTYQDVSIVMSRVLRYAFVFACGTVTVMVGVILGFVVMTKMLVADIYAQKAVAMHAVGNHTQSSAFFGKALDMNNKEGRYFTTIGQYALELAYTERMHTNDAEDSSAAAEYGAVAIDAVTSGQELMPHDVLANEVKGYVYEQSGSVVAGALTASIDAYTRASELEPYNPYFDIAIGKLKFIEAQAMGDVTTEQKTALIEQAKASFEHAKEKTTFDIAGNNEQTVSFFAPAHYYIALSYEALGDIDKAIDVMAEALRIAKDYGSDEKRVAQQINYAFNLARLLQLRGGEEDVAYAQELLTQIIVVDDREINAYFGRAILYEKQNKRSEAIAEYQKILDILPQDKTAERARVQEYIDTVHQGKDNLQNSIFEQTTVSPTDVRTDETPSQSADMPESEDVIIVQRGGEGMRARQVHDALYAIGINASIREEDDAYFEGIAVMHTTNADRAVRDVIMHTLRKVFDQISLERSDADGKTYNHDVVIIVGE
ncbi:MAG: hypothetical protein CR954_00030 [Candidatus Moraniibacteriota bacterium]|nr:MAG: hypothetical protein CR954_00030 [Candidatus Moranbacteria bacterium]